MGTESCIVSFNEEKLSVKGIHGIVSTCFSYPSKVQIRIFFFILFLGKIFCHYISLLSHLDYYSLLHTNRVINQFICVFQSISL